MRVCIIGCGAVGGLFGAHLATHSHIEVWAYDKNPIHCEAINSHGLTLHGAVQRNVSLNATSDPNDIPLCDVGIVATKFYHTQAAIEATAHLVQDGLVCSLQNGVGNEAILSRFVRCVASGSTLAGGHISAPGQIHVDTIAASWLGPYRAELGEKQIREVVELLTKAKLETHYTEQPHSIKWSKLIFNAAANPLCALTGLSFGEVYQVPELRKLMYDVAIEGMQVAAAANIDLHDNPIEMLDAASESAATHIPSMLVDVQQQVPTEIDALNGGILSHADQLAVPCPANKSVVALIKGLEHSWPSFNNCGEQT